MDRLCVIVAAFASVHGKVLNLVFNWLAQDRCLIYTGKKKQRNSQVSKWQRGI